MSSCLKCKFRLYTHRRVDFHCAANRNGWAFTSNERDALTMPEECPRMVPGDGITVGKELPAGEFWTIAGGRITAEDWKRWSDKGVKP